MIRRVGFQQTNQHQTTSFQKQAMESRNQYNEEQYNTGGLPPREQPPVARICCNPIDFREIFMPFSRTMDSIDDYFPGAISNRDFCDMIKDRLRKYNFGLSSLVATSLCSDEVTRPLEKELEAMYGKHYSMGGLAGVPFGGTTAFSSMAQHIPDGGSCLIVYGPHIGIDTQGNVGTVGRRGKHIGGACCASAITAARYVKNVKEGLIAPLAHIPEECLDVEQAYVGNMLLPYYDRLKRNTNPMAELPRAMFEILDDLMLKIVRKSCGCVEDDGKIAIVGGIQINTPPGMSDFFLPLRFEVLDNRAKAIAKIIQGPCTAVTKVFKVFPKALTLPDLVKRTKTALSKYNYGSNTLLCTSLCCDEVNRSLEEAFRKIYGDNFNIGGLAGFPFGGCTGFCAMATHIPDGGTCLLVYGSHVGIDSDGNVGTVDRRGRSHGGPCCVAAISALNYVHDFTCGSCDEDELTIEPLNAQQVFVERMVLARADRLNRAGDKMVELPLVLFQAQDELMMKIIQKGIRFIPKKGKIALLGGVQINTPEGMDDFFLPLRFDLRDQKNDVIRNFMAR